MKRRTNAAWWLATAFVCLTSCAGSTRAVRRDCLSGDSLACEQLASQHEYLTDREQWLEWTTAACEAGSGWRCWKVGLHNETVGDLSAAGMRHHQGCVHGAERACLSLGYLSAAGMLDESALTHQGRALAAEHAAFWGELRTPVWVTEDQNGGRGELHSQSLRDALRAHSPKLTTCYERGLALRPELRGRLEVQFTVGADGSVTEAHIRESELEDPLVEDCFVRSFYALETPPPPDGPAVVRVPYTMELGE